VHLTTDGGPEDPIVLVTEFLHGEPRCHWVDIVDTSNVGNSAGWAR
jgi:hypothetical protein